MQTPAETIRRGSGACRDFGLLFMEAARSLGFAARFVTGYLHDEAAGNESGEDMTGGGATHAWADIFVPGAGWVEFDPTNRIIASRNLIRVATTRTPSQALPVSGTFVRGGGEFLGLQVAVSVANVECGCRELTGMVAALRDAWAMGDSVPFQHRPAPAP